MIKVVVLETLFTCKRVSNFRKRACTDKVFRTLRSATKGSAFRIRHLLEKVDENFCFRSFSVRRYSLVNITAAEDFDHLFAEVVHDGKPCFGRKLINIGLEQVVLQVDLFQHHLGVEQVCFINVDVHRIISCAVYPVRYNPELR